MKIALVCSHGGHLTEMLYLMDAFEGHEVFFVTYDSPRTRALKYKKYLFPNFGEKPLKLLKNMHRILGMLRKEKPDVIVSNGAEIAIPFSYIGELFRIKTIFIECYTRVEEPTITGKLVYLVSNRFLVLWPELLAKYGGKAEHWGGLFNVINDNHSEITKKSEDIIFVTVGMHYQGFERLVKKMDEIAEKIEEEVVMQIGNTKYEPKYAKYFDFEDYDKIKDIIKKARIVVCPGAMSAIDSLVVSTPVIVVPRLKEQGEAINDHQLIFARKLEEIELVKVIDDMDELEDNILTSAPIYIKNLVVNGDLITKLTECLKLIKFH